MISLELSTVQQNRERSAQLDAAVSDFLAHGGAISTLQGFACRPKPEPKPYGRQCLDDRPAPEPKRRPPPRPVDKSAQVKARLKARDEQFQRIRELAQTMTITQVVHKSGLSNQRLRSIAAEVGFQFQKFDPTQNLKPNQDKRESDAANVARIIEARDRGLSRKAAKDEMGISNSLMKRLIAEYQIDYPLQRLRR